MERRPRSSRRCGGRVSGDSGSPPATPLLRLGRVLSQCLSWEPSVAEVSVATWNFSRRWTGGRATYRRHGGSWRKRSVPPSRSSRRRTVFPATKGGRISSRDDAIRYETAVVGDGAEVRALTDVTTRSSSRYAFAITPKV